MEKKDKYGKEGNKDLIPWARAFWKALKFGIHLF
jgi:hypothetical protein